MNDRILCELSCEKGGEMLGRKILASSTRIVVFPLVDKPCETRPLAGVCHLYRHRQTSRM